MASGTYGLLEPLRNFNIVRTPASEDLTVFDNVGLHLAEIGLGIKFEHQVAGLVYIGGRMLINTLSERYNDLESAKVVLQNIVNHSKTPYLAASINIEKFKFDYVSGHSANNVRKIAVTYPTPQEFLGYNGKDWGPHNLSREASNVTTELGMAKALRNSINPVLHVGSLVVDNPDLTNTQVRTTVQHAFEFAYSQAGVGLGGICVGALCAIDFGTGDRIDPSKK